MQERVADRHLSDLQATGSGVTRHFRTHPERHILVGSRYRYKRREWLLSVTAIPIADIPLAPPEQSVCPADAGQATKSKCRVQKTAAMAEAILFDFHLGNDRIGL